MPEKLENIFVRSFLVQTKTAKSPFEINWPLTERRILEAWIMEMKLLLVIIFVMAKIDHDLFCAKRNISISWSKTIMKKGGILFLIFLLSFEIVARPVTVKGDINEWWIVLTTVWCERNTLYWMEYQYCVEFDPDFTAP